MESARGNIEDRSPANFLCWVFLFPIFTGGPIERFDHFLRESRQSLSPQMISEGITRIAVGLATPLSAALG